MLPQQAFALAQRKRGSVCHESASGLVFFIFNIQSFSPLLLNWTEVLGEDLLCYNSSSLTAVLFCFRRLFHGRTRVHTDLIISFLLLFAARLFLRKGAGESSSSRRNEHRNQFEFQLIVLNDYAARNTMSISPP